MKQVLVRLPQRHRRESRRERSQSGEHLSPLRA
jgi:hypothetical protein